MELQLSRTASDVLSEFEVIIIDTAKIKSCFWQKTKPVLSKTLVSLDTPLVYDINADFGHRYLEFFLHSINGITRHLIYRLPKKQSTKNNCRLYNNLVGIIFGST